MPRDSTWEDVWAEYDARQCASAATPRQAETTTTRQAPTVEARRQLPGAGPVARPRRLAAAGVLALLVMLLGLPLGEAGAPAVASQEPVFQRHTMIVVGLSGETDMAESPASAPPEAVLLAEAAMLPMPVPAWVQPNAASAVEAPPPPTARRPARPQRRLARPSQPPAQLATTAAADQPWFEPTRTTGQSRRASQPARNAGAAWAPLSPPQASSSPPPTYGHLPAGRGAASGMGAANLSAIHRHLNTA